VTTETITLALSGDLTLDVMSNTLSRYWRVVRAISRAAAGKEGIDWVLEAVEKNGLIATYGSSAPAALQAGLLYDEAGEALASHDLTGLTKPVRDAGWKLLECVDGDVVESMRLETPRRDATIYQFPPGKSMPGVAPKPEPIPPALGAVQGRVQTLSTRGSLHFILYDVLRDRPVSCYLAADVDNESLMKDVWGKLVVVDGLVKRDHRTGRPITIRQVRDVQRVEEVDIRSYRSAKGKLPWIVEGESSEALVRRLRDAQ
jgi:hypothetical protein